jgi:hypothetical protein
MGQNKLRAVFVAVAPRSLLYTGRRGSRLFFRDKGQPSPLVVFDHSSAICTEHGANWMPAFKTSCPTLNLWQAANAWARLSARSTS